MTTRTENIADIYREIADRLETHHGRAARPVRSHGYPGEAPAQPDTLVTAPHQVATSFFSLAGHPSEGRLRQMAYPSTQSESQPGATRR